MNSVLTWQRRLSALFSVREEGGGHERHRGRRARNIQWTIVVSLVARVILYGVGILSVPLTIGYLGDERYGVWITISTTIGWLLLLDFGLGAGLRNMLAEAYGQESQARAKEHLSTVFWFLCGVALLLAASFVVLFPIIPWPSVFNTGTSVPASDLDLAVAIVLIVFVLRFPLSIVSIIYSGFQEGYVSAVWDAVGGVGSLVALWLVTRMEGGLAALALAVSGSSLVFTFLNGLYLFGWHKPWLRPSLRQFRRTALTRTMDLGLKFFVIQVAGVLVYQSSSIVITQLLGPRYVTPYSLVYRLFWLLISVQSLFITPLWPAYTESVARGDWRWAQASLSRSVIISMTLGSVAILGLILLGRPVIKLWSGTDILPTQGLLVLMGLWALSYMWQNPFSLFLNGIGSISLMSKLTIVAALANLLLCVIFGLWLGLEGVGLAGFLTTIPGAVLFPVESRARLKAMAKQSGMPTKIK